jgi:hypothetical protein
MGVPDDAVARLVCEVGGRLAGLFGVTFESIPACPAVCAGIPLVVDVELDVVEFGVAESGAEAGVFDVELAGVASAVVLVIGGVLGFAIAGFGLVLGAAAGLCPF